MTTFATAFSSSDQEDKNYSDTFEMNNPTNDFSNVDLDQQVVSFENHHSSAYLSFNKPVVLENNMSTLSPERVSRHSLSSNSTDRRRTMPDISKLSMTSAAAVAAVGPKFDKLKQWGRTTYKCTKQTLFEKLGKTTRTVDVELDGQIEQFRETKRRYEAMLALARSYANHFYNLMQTQKSLSEQFLELKQRSSHLADEFSCNAHTQSLLVENGQTLFLALNYFISSLTTLCTKTMEDTLSTIRSYETARLEYDACRRELELLSGNHLSADKQNDLEKYRNKYEQLKCSVQVKLQLLDENQVKVMKNQLLLFHNAIAAYFSGNKQVLDGTMKQFNLKVTSNNENNHEKQSFLEQFHR